MNISSFLKPALAGSSFIALLSFSSCNSGSATSGYITSPNGLDYKIITDNKQPKAKVGDYVQYYSTIRNAKDSIIFTMNSTHVAELGLVAAPKEKGDPIEVLTMLGKGDSASCLIPAEEFFKNIEIPAPIKKGDKLKLDLKIIDVFSKDQYDAKVAEMEAQKTAAASQPGINYMKDHNLNGIPMAGGMYYVVDKPGTGAQPVAGKKVKVNYRGTLLDGTEFDSSLQPGREPFEFTLGQGQVIKGWDQGIPMFKVGGKGKLIIPPSMGYGENGQGKIPANSWLIFDIEVLGVSDAAPQAPQTIQMK
ncbi:MAG: FKBP-type peptidyl-prolyl cis-trans isomerase [Bacteroidota bacterium]